MLDQIVKLTNLLILKGIKNQKWILSILTCFCFFTSFAQLQQDIQTPKIVPPSPDAAALGKYGQIPVDKSTGIPEISVPLYEIKTPRFSMPISLSYHASGIKVDEISSWVGCGWVLNAGGAITRSIVGFPDDGPYGILNNTIVTAANIQFTRDYTYIANVLNKRLDTEPDNFFYNFNGHSGAFVFGSGNVPVLIPYKPIIINFSSSTGFNVIDEEGNKYSFNTKENVTSSISSQMSGISSWYLTQMVSADLSDTINFVYTSDVAVLSDFTLNFTQNISQNYSPYSLGTITQLQQMVETNPTRQFNPVRISSIRYKGGKVDFISRTGRLDDGNTSLDSVVISNQDPKSNQYTRLKSFKFLTDYFYSTLSIPPSLVYTEASKHRLKLTGLQENDRNNLAVDSFKFDYNPGMLPAVHSFAQDNWGYFNGKTQNLSLLEAQSVIIYPSGSSSPVMATIGGTQGADRSVSPTDLQASTLTKITYPTKGYTMFAYENNMSYGTTQITTSFNSSAIGLHQETFSLTYTPTASMLQTGGNIFRVQLREGSDNPGYPLATIQIVRVSDGIVMYSITANQTGNIDQTVFVSLAPDVAYQLNTVAHGGTDPTSSTLPYAIITTSCQIPSAPGLINSGGLRVTSITNYNNDGTLVNTETYKYGTGESGYGTTLSVYTSQHFNQADEYLSSLAFCPGSQSGDYTFLFAPVIVYSNNSFYPLGSLNGSPIAYPSVTIYHGDLVQNTGKSIYNYNIYGDSIYVVPTSQYANGFRPTPVTWKNGETAYEGHYLNTNGQYSIVKESTNTFNLISRKYPTGTVIGYSPEPVGYNFDNPFLSNGQVASVTACLTFTWSPQNFYWFDYPITTGSRVLQQNVTSTYGPDGISKITDTTKYYYGNLSHMFPTRIVTFTSKGDSIIKILNYPQDMVNSGSDPTGVYASMSTANILSTTIQNIGLKNTTQLVKTKTNYAKFNNLFYEPQTVEFQNGSNPSEVKLTYQNYDSRGNLLRVTGEDGLPSTYIWDYQYALPIAKISDSALANVAFTGFDADGTGNWTVTSSTRDATNFLTGIYSYNLSNGSISKSGLTIGKVYIISLWSKSATYSIAGGTTVTTTGRSFGSWTYKENQVTATSTTMTISGSGNIDELRLYPLGSQMTSYTYTPQVGATAINDQNSEITFYEYDAIQRLQNIKDYQGNIIKNFQYNYAQACTSCSLVMKNLGGTATISYPVGVFSVANKLLGNATTPAQYISLWNADVNNNTIGTITAGSDSMHFILAVKSGQTSPGFVTGCRYYQYDLPYTQFDAVIYRVGCYVDFGDGTGMSTGKYEGDLTVIPPVNTVANVYYNYLGPHVYWIHNYPDGSLKTLTFYHNDGSSSNLPDDYNIPASSLMLLQNLRGNLPQNCSLFGANCFQQSSAETVSAISNWNSISSISSFTIVSGDYKNPCLHVSYAQDFMANNKNLQSINTTRGYYLEGCEDLTFKLSKLKSNWNSYFTNLTSLFICDDHWNREDLTNLTRLNQVIIYSGNTLHSFNQTGNPLVPIPTAAIDNMINQVSAGAGLGVSNGLMNIYSGGGVRSSNSNTAVIQLKSKGWTIIVNGVTQ